MEVVKAGHRQAGIDSFDDPAEIISTLLQAAGLVRSRMSAFLDRFELTEARHSVLSSISHAGAKGLSQSEVAEQQLQSESNVSSLIDRLHRDGLVDRRWSDTDRRKRVLLLTPDGEELIERVEVARRRWAESLLSGLTADHRRAMNEGLGILALRTDERGGRRVAGTNLAVHPKPGTEQADWPPEHRQLDPDSSSPHVALEQMLSTLGLVGRFAEEEQ